MTRQSTPNMWQRYGKAFAAVAGAALTVAYGALSGDQAIEPDEWVQIAIAAATAIGVYVVPLDTRWRWGKTAVAVILSVLQVLTTAVIGGLDPSEWIALLIAAATVLGVGLSPAMSGQTAARNPVRRVVREF